MADDKVTKALTGLLQDGVKGHVAPGMACAVGTADKTWFAHAGHHSYDSKSAKITDDTVWDLASVTKIAATTSVAMGMYQAHELDLDSHVQSVVTDFVGKGKEDVTVRNLLRHDSGLAAYGDYEGDTSAKDVKERILHSRLIHKPCSVTEYSCLGFVTLAEVLQRLTRQSLDELVAKYVTGPLKLKDTYYKPVYDDRRSCAPTEEPAQWRLHLDKLRGFKSVNSRYIQGAVHDPIAYLIGGVSGNAGLFSTTGDLVKLVRSWMLPGTGPFSKETLSLFTTRQGKSSTYGLGFDTRSEEDSTAGTKFSLKSFGHTGYTGTTIWVDPEALIFAVLLTNRICPTAANIKIRDFRPPFHDAVYSLLVQ
ncbi:MAG TPA: serine hydrolase domain-containing protein [Fimbriimonadaceae bacterium]|nr:serine hydrolase domain-containing protein [Fimbriimonadaceae bacterium]